MKMIISWIPMPKATRQKILNGRKRNNTNTNDTRSDGQNAHKLDTFDEAEYGESLIIR